MHRVSLAFAANALCPAGYEPTFAQEADATIPDVSADQANTNRVTLYLEVAPNSKPTNLMAEFAQEPHGGRMFSQKSEWSRTG
jgi:hypothetical protein